MAMTPRARSDGPSEASLLSAPRSLNEFVTCRFSYLTWTFASVRAESFGAGSIGVRTTWPAMVRRAFSMSSSVMLMPRLRPEFGGLPTHRAQIARASCFGTVYSPFAQGFEDETMTDSGP